MGSGLRRSLDITEHSLGNGLCSGKTLLLRALTPGEIAHAKGARMIGCIHKKLARGDFALGNFFRIIDPKVSYFLCLSVVVHMDFESHLNFFRLCA